MKLSPLLPARSIAAPIACWLVLAGTLVGPHGVAYEGVLAVGLLADVGTLPLSFPEVQSRQ